MKSIPKTWWKWTPAQWDARKEQFTQEITAQAYRIFDEYKTLDPVEVADFMGSIMLGFDNELVSDFTHVCEVASALHVDKVCKAKAAECFADMKILATKLSLLNQWGDVIAHLRNSRDVTVVRILEEVQSLRKIKGMHLSAPEQKKFSKLFGEIKKLGKAFDSATDLYEKKLLCTRADIEGLSENFIAGLERKGDKYIVTTASHCGPQFVTNTSNLVLARKMAVLMSLEGGTINLKRLQKMVALRHELAVTAGFKDFASMMLSARSEKDPKKVLAQFDKLMVDARELFAQDIAVFSHLSGIKKQIPSWMTARIGKKFTMEVMKMPDPQVIKEYFQTDVVVPKVLKDIEKLLGLSVTKSKVSVWDKNVDAYDVYDGATQKHLGTIYLDIYYRQNKKENACCMTYSEGKQSSYMPRIVEQSQARASMLIMSLPVPSKKAPSLMSFYDLEVLFHELGHAFHNILGAEHHASIGGINVSFDSVEVPSQFFEFFLMAPDVVKRYSSHLVTGQQLSDDIVEKLLIKRDMMMGYFLMLQCHFSTYDLLIHSSKRDEDVHEFYRARYAKILKGIEPLEESLFPAGFGHIAHGYEASYYSYLTTKLIATDLAQWAKTSKGWDAKKLAKITQELFASGNTKSINDICKNILGRDVDTSAMLASIKRVYQKAQKLGYLK